MNPEIIKRQIENLKLQLSEWEPEDWLLSLESETDLDSFLMNAVKRIEDAKALVVGTKEYIEELRTRRSRFEWRIETLRNMIAVIMDRADVRKRELPLATLSVRAGSPQLLGDNDPENLPAALVRIKYELNKPAIKAALQAGETVPGFSLSNSQPQLTIRIK